MDFYNGLWVAEKFFIALKGYNLDSAKKKKEKKKKRKTKRYNLDFNLLYFIFKINFSYKVDYSLRLQLYLVKKNITTYFENLTIELHVLYALNTYVKFCVNRILFTI